MLAYLARRLARPARWAGSHDGPKPSAAEPETPAVTGSRRRPVPPTPSLHSATRDYARIVEAGYLSRVQSRDLARLIEAMGIELWAWQYARRLTGQTPWRAGQNVVEAFERARVAREMTADLATWERAIAAVDMQASQARITGDPPPETLAVPSEIQAAIESRRLAAAERATRRRERGGDGRAGSKPLPEEAVHHPPYPGRHSR